MCGMIHMPSILSHTLFVPKRDLFCNLTETTNRIKNNNNNKKKKQKPETSEAVKILSYIPSRLNLLIQDFSDPVKEIMG